MSIAKQYLIWDLGASKCAAAIISKKQNGEFSCSKKTYLKLSEVESLSDLIARIEHDLETQHAEVDGICIAAAGHYDGEALHAENAYPFAMPFAKLAKENTWPKFCVVHDYVSAVCASFTDYMQQPGNIKVLRQGQQNQYGRRLVFGLGTGLGLKDAALLPSGELWVGENEAGHMGVTLPAIVDTHRLAEHHEFMSFLRAKYQLGCEQQTLSFEKILSGPGLSRLHQFAQNDTREKTPEEVGAELQSGAGQSTLRLLAWYLGLFVGNLELLFMPSGGLWIAGGVVQKHMSIFDEADFWTGIAATPAYWQEREVFPLGVMCGDEHVFYGGAFYFEQFLKSSYKR